MSVRAATDSDTMLRALQQAMQSFESVKSLKKSYGDRYPDSSLELHLENKLSGDDLKRYKMILSGTYTARKRIELAMGEGIDPDEKQIWAAFQDATPPEIEELRKEYKNQGEIYKMFKGGIFTGLSKENLLRAKAMLGAGSEGEDPVLTKLKAQGGVNGGEIVKVIKNALKSDWKEYHDAYLKGTGPLRTFADELLDAEGKGQVAGYLQDSALSRIKYGIDHQDVEYVTLQIIGYASEEEKKSILGDAALMGNIGSYFNAREANKIRDLLIPANLSPEEKAKLLGDKISRESSFLFGATANAEALEDEQRELRIALEKAKVDGQLTPEEQKKIEQLTKQTEGALAAYMGVRDELNGYLETALDVAASIAVTVATGGAGAPMLAGAVARAALAQAVVSVVVKKIVHGDNFDVLSPEAVGVFAAGFVDGAMNALGGKAAEKAVSAALRDSARATALETGNVVFKSSGRRILTQTAEGVISNSPGAMVSTAVDDGTWKEGFAKGFGAVLESGLVAGAQGAAMNLTIHALAKGVRSLKAELKVENTATGQSHTYQFFEDGTVGRCSPSCPIQTPEIIQQRADAIGSVLQHDHPIKVLANELAQEVRLLVPEHARIMQLPLEQQAERLKEISTKWERHERAMAKLESKIGTPIEQSEKKSFNEFWKGRATETSFGVSNKNFGELEDLIQSRRQILLGKGQGHLLPQLNTGVLNMLVDVFIISHGSPELKAEWMRLKNNPAFKNEIERVFGVGKDSILRNRVPDFVEFDLTRGTVEISHVTLRHRDPVHALKTSFYREVMQSLLGSRGARVTAFELYPARPGYLER